MVKRSTEKLTLEIGKKVEVMPKGARSSETSKEYNKTLDVILSMEKGCYPISIQGRKMESVYTALVTRVKERKLSSKLKLHKISGVLYIEKI